MRVTDRPTKFLGVVISLLRLGFLCHQYIAHAIDQGLGRCVRFLQSLLNRSTWQPVNIELAFLGIGDQQRILQRSLERLAECRYACRWYLRRCHKGASKQSLVEYERERLAVIIRLAKLDTTGTPSLFNSG
jgi:hypothetical protein